MYVQYCYYREPSPPEIHRKQRCHNDMEIKQTCVRWRSANGQHVIQYMAPSYDRIYICDTKVHSYLLSENR